MQPAFDVAEDVPISVAAGGMPIVMPPAGLGLVSAVDWLNEHSRALRRTLHHHGFAMIRGLPISTVADVAAVRDALTSEPAMNRERTAERTHFGAEVYSANDLPPAHRIGFHNENSYALEFPGVVLFSCLEAPNSGGCTAVADGRKVLADLPTSFRERLSNHGWLLTRHYHRHVGQSLESAFGTTSPAHIAEHCHSNVIGHEWLTDGVLRTTQRRTAVVSHPVTDEQTLFSHVSFWSSWSLPPEVREVLAASYGKDRMPFETSFGDGQPIDQHDMDALNAAYERHACREPWKVGDVLLVDNLLASHARDPFKGRRRVVVTMAEMLTLADCCPTVQAAPSGN